MRSAFVLALLFCFSASALAEEPKLTLEVFDTSRAGKKLENEYRIVLTHSMSPDFWNPRIKTFLKKECGTFKKKNIGSKLNTNKVLVHTMDYSVNKKPSFAKILVLGKTTNEEVYLEVQGDIAQKRLLETFSVEGSTVYIKKK